MPLVRTESPSPTIVDRLTADVVRSAFSEEAVMAGREAVVAGRVSRPSLGLTRADAAVADGGRVMRVRLFWSGESLGASCSCRQRHCAHAAALALLLIGVARSEEDSPEGRASSLREEERRRREARGSTELFEIVRLAGTGLYGDYGVSSPSSQAYRVTLRAFDAAHNGCNCPDFATNLLGTCKHVEAVLRHLRADAARRLKKAIADGPLSSYVHLVFEPEESISVRPRTRSAGGRAARGGALLRCRRPALAPAL